MAAVQKISVALTAELAGDVEAAVAAGDYATASEVVRDALRVWKQRRAEQAAEIERLRALWREGIESGEPRPVPDDWVEQIVAEGNKRLAMRKKGEAA